MNARRALKLLLVALFVLLAPSALAGPNEERLARAKFEEGLALSDAGRWAEALEAFQESDKLKPAASARFNIAATLRALGRYVEAKSTAQSILDEAAVLKPKPKTLQQVKDLLKEVSAKIARVELSVSPSGADVEVDGEPVTVGPDRLEIDPGRHVFVIKAKGHDTTTITREVPEGESRVELTAPKTPPPPPRPDGGTEEEETPIYETWYLWTGIAGAAAAVAVVVVVVVLTLPEEEAAASPPPSTVGHPIPVIIRW